MLFYLAKQKGLFVLGSVIALLLFSCKTSPNQSVPVEEPQDPFLGVYAVQFPPSKHGTITYSVEFKADKTARVLIFKNENPQPRIHSGRWLVSKDGIIILYFSQTVPPEFFLKNDDGTLSLLDGMRRPYKDRLGEIMKLEKLKTLQRF